MLIVLHSGIFLLHGAPENLALAGEKMLMIGHRGAAGLAPENTMAAFRRALDLGVDAIELDVLLSSDGEIMVHHNFSLNPDIARIEGRWIDKSPPAVIGKMSFRELRAYDVGRLRPSSSYGARYPEQQPSDGERIPTLREVISLLKGRKDQKTRIWIEFKTSPEEPRMTPPPEHVADAVIRLLKEEGFLSRVAFLSFDWRGLVHAQRIAPEVPTIFLSLSSLNLDNIQRGRPGGSPWMAGVDIDDFNGSIPQAVKAAGGRHWAPYFNSVSVEQVEESHQLGIKVLVWTPDSEKDMLRMMKLNVDAITTNRPDILSRLLEREP